MRIPGKEITRRGRTETSKRAVAALSPTILSWSCVMSSKLTRAVARRGTAEGEVSSTKGRNLIVSRPEKGRIADTAEKGASELFCRRGIFWRLCDISPPLLAFDFSVERRRGDPARFWYRRRVHARRVQTSAVNPRSDADARNRAKGRTEGGDQDAPTGGATRLVKGKNALQLQRGARDTTSRVSHLLGEHVRGGRQRGISVAHALLVQG